MATLSQVRASVAAAQAAKQQEPQAEEKDSGFTLAGLTGSLARSGVGLGKELLASAIPKRTDSGGEFHPHRQKQPSQFAQGGGKIRQVVPPAQKGLKYHAKLKAQKRFQAWQQSQGMRRVKQQAQKFKQHKPHNFKHFHKKTFFEKVFG